MANITLQTIESLPLVEEVNENTSLVGWDGEKTVRVPKDMVGGSELPEVTVEDNDKVLGVVDGAVGLMEVPKELPENPGNYKNLVTDKNGNWVVEDRLAFTNLTTYFEWDGNLEGLQESQYIQMYTRFVGPLQVPEDFRTWVFDYNLTFKGNSLVVPNGEFLHYSGEYTYEVGNGSYYVKLPDCSHAVFVYVAESDVGNPLAIYNGNYENTQTTNITFAAAGLWVYQYGSTESGNGLQWMGDKYVQKVPEEYIERQVPTPEYVDSEVYKTLYSRGVEYRIDHARIVFTKFATDVSCSVPFEDFNWAVQSGVPFVLVDRTDETARKLYTCCSVKYIADSSEWRIDVYDPAENKTIITIHRTADDITFELVS